MTATLDLDQLVLKHGSHTSREQGVCLMEAVAWYAGKSHSDMPPCVSPVLRSYGISLNDRLPDERRQDLKRFIPALVGTADDGLDDARRALASKVLMTEWLPAWLRLAKLDDLAVQAEAGAGLQGKDLSKALYAIRDLTWKARTERRAALTEQIKTELLKKWSAEGKPDAAADAVADAAAAADAVADADAAAAAAAVADAAAAAAAVADADAVADAVADAAAAAAAAAAAVAVAVAVAAADAVAVAAAPKPYSDQWYALRSKVHEAVYAAVKNKFETSDTFAAVRALRGQQLDAAIDLYDRMIHVANVAVSA